MWPCNCKSGYKSPELVGWSKLDDFANSSQDSEVKKDNAERNTSQKGILLSQGAEQNSAKGNLKRTISSELLSFVIKKPRKLTDQSIETKGKRSLFHAKSFSKIEAFLNQNSTAVSEKNSHVDKTKIKKERHNSFNSLKSSENFSSKAISIFSSEEPQEQSPALDFLLSQSSKLNDKLVITNGVHTLKTPDKAKVTENQKFPCDKKANGSISKVTNGFEYLKVETFMQPNNANNEISFKDCKQNLDFLSQPENHFYNHDESSMDVDSSQNSQASSQEYYSNEYETPKKKIFKKRSLGRAESRIDKSKFKDLKRKLSFTKKECSPMQILHCIDHEIMPNNDTPPAKKICSLYPSHLVKKQLQLQNKNLEKKNNDISENGIWGPNICESDENCENVSTKSKLITVTLYKGSFKKLGFTISGGADQGGIGIYVKSIFPNGQAVEPGKLRAGDEIIAINALKVKGKSHSEVLNLIKNSPKPGNLNLLIRRQLKVKSSL